MALLAMYPIGEFSYKFPEKEEGFTEVLTEAYLYPSPGSLLVLWLGTLMRWDLLSTGKCGSSWPRWLFPFWRRYWPSPQKGSNEASWAQRFQQRQLQSGCQFGSWDVILRRGQRNRLLNWESKVLNIPQLVAEVYSELQSLLPEMNPSTAVATRESHTST